MDHYETVKIGKAEPPRGGLWSPEEGPETNALLRHFANKGIDSEAQSSILTQAVGILSHCTPPSEPAGQSIGLAIGYVQSGKTMSFTTVAALARDNGYRIVIVLAGVSTPLLTQSTERLEKDLRLNDRADRKWKTFKNPTVQNDKAGIESALDNWNDLGASVDEQQTVLITVMKNVTRVRSLNKLLEALRPKLDGAPVLVIDDEADQAGLNTRIRNDEQSPTYRQLLALRRALPHHAYLQYTATPQAPLLINIIDVLSPSFAWILDPGTAYTGGKTFFVDRGDLLSRIPDAEIPGGDNLINEPPPSLLHAMRLFFLGVAAGLDMDKGSGNRSMIIHPSQQKDSHATYVRWVNNVKGMWGEMLLLPDGDPDKQHFFEDFRGIHKMLLKTVQGLPDFDALMRRLPKAVRQTIVKELNTRNTSRIPEVRWRDEYAHILVGGQALDRGFTVEGLTVTYMPRGVGVGNADTVQQRARFFGYKRGYLGFCHVFLGDEARHGFVTYVEHEENLRGQLKAFDQKGQSLSQWKRAFFLENEFRPTRTSVLDLEMNRITLSDRWFAPDAPHLPLEGIAANTASAVDFLSSILLTPDIGHPNRTEFQRHNVATARLSDVYEHLLVGWRFELPLDSQKFTALLLLVKDHLENHPDAFCTIFQMSQGRIRERKATNDSMELFQGAYPDKAGEVYLGDRAIHTPNDLSIQVHTLRVERVNGEESAILEGVTALTIWVPREIGKGVLVQDEANRVG